MEKYEILNYPSLLKLEITFKNKMIIDILYNCLKENYKERPNAHNLLTIINNYTNKY
jgi:hypothetical protein